MNSRDNNNTKLNQTHGTWNKLMKSYMILYQDILKGDADNNESKLVKLNMLRAVYNNLQSFEMLDEKTDAHRRDNLEFLAFQISGIVLTQCVPDNYELSDLPYFSESALDSAVRDSRHK